MLDATMRITADPTHHEISPGLQLLPCPALGLRPELAPATARHPSARDPTPGMCTISAGALAKKTTHDQTLRPSSASINTRSTMKFYVHHGDLPEFTAVFRVPACLESQLRLSELATWFRDTFNAKHGPEVEFKQSDQLVVRAGPTQREFELRSLVRKVLREGSDVYISRRRWDQGALLKGGITPAAHKDGTPPAPPPHGPAARGSDDQFNPVISQLLETAIKSETAKNFRQASHIYEQLLSIVSPGTDTAKSCLERLVDLWLLVERPPQALRWAREASSQFPGNPDVLKRLGDCLSHPLASPKSLSEALTVYTAAEAHVTDIAKKRELQLLRARVLYDSGSASNQARAASMIMDVVGQDQSDWEGLFLYAKVAKDRGMLSDSVRVLLRLLVQRPNNSDIRRDLSEILKQDKGMDVLLGELNGEAHTDAALAFLATCVKDYGAVDASIELFSRALALRPLSPSYLLNLIHVYELNQNYQQCISLVADFCKEYDSGLPLLCLGTVADILRSIPDFFTSSIGWVSIEAATSLQAFSMEQAHRSATGKVLYNVEQLDTLAAIMTAVKVLFVGGALQHAALLSQLVQAPVQASEKPLHTTLIRNEAAYLGCVQQILERPDKPQPCLAVNTNPLFLVGDSHSLSAAWHQVELRSEKRLIVPRLVTGCKVWHLRPESVFYPKVAFQNTVQAIPKNAQVIMLLGEIDCREGLLVAVEKCKYETLQEGIEATVNIYLEVLQMLQQRGMEVFVHPVPPVLDETRHIVLPFNAVLKEKVLKYGGAAPGNKIQWLDFLDDLLSPDKSKLKNELQFDGTHLSPSYVQYLDRALALVD